LHLAPVLRRVLNKTNAGAYRRRGFDRPGCTDDNLPSGNYLKIFSETPNAFSCSAQRFIAM